jgi:hypothetical protein
MGNAEAVKFFEPSVVFLHGLMIGFEIEGWHRQAVSLAEDLSASHEQRIRPRNGNDKRFVPLHWLVDCISLPFYADADDRPTVIARISQLSARRRRKRWTQADGIQKARELTLAQNLRALQVEHAVRTASSWQRPRDGPQCDLAAEGLMVPLHSIKKQRDIPFFKFFSPCPLDNAQGVHNLTSMLPKGD